MNNSNSSGRAQDDNNKLLWKYVVSNLKDIIDPVQFKNWFSEIQFCYLQHNTIFLKVVDEFTRNWLINNYFIIIRNTTRSIFKKVTKVSFIVKNTHTNWIKDSSIVIFSSLNPKYTLTNFFRCSENDIAYQVCKQVGINSGITLPNGILYLYADVGMGKSHLLQSLAHFLIQENPHLTIVYLSAEKFMLNFISAVKKNTLFELRKANTQADFYLIDDIHFISGKHSTQKEFSFIIRSLLAEGKKVILTSVISPYLLDFYDQRTKSLLRSSHILNIKRLSFNSRVQFLKFLLIKSKICFDNHVLEILSKKVTSSFRELESVFVNMSNFFMMTNKSICNENIFSFINNNIGISTKKVLLSDIIHSVIKFYGVSKIDILSKKRNFKTVAARIMIAQLSKELLPVTLKTIGNAIGGRSHTTVLYYLKQFSVFKQNKVDFMNEYYIIKSSIDL